MCFLSVHGKTLDTEVRSKLLAKQFASNFEKTSFPLREAFKAILCSFFEAKKPANLHADFYLMDLKNERLLKCFFILVKGTTTRYMKNTKEKLQKKIVKRFLTLLTPLELCLIHCAARGNAVWAAGGGLSGASLSNMNNLQKTKKANVLALKQPCICSCVSPDWLRIFTRTILRPLVSANYLHAHRIHYHEEQLLKNVMRSG